MRVRIVVYPHVVLPRKKTLATEAIPRINETGKTVGFDAMGLQNNSGIATIPENRKAIKKYIKLKTFTLHIVTD